MPPKRFPKREPAGRQPPVARPPQTSLPSETASSSTVDENLQRYEEELAWCIHKLKVSLTAKNLTPRQVEDVRKSISILENPNENVVKKRCIMQTSLGNYRQLMEQEKCKVSLDLRKARIVTGATSSSGQFMRKSHSASDDKAGKFSYQPSGNTFRFNFHMNAEEEK